MEDSLELVKRYRNIHNSREGDTVIYKNFFARRSCANPEENKGVWDTTGHSLNSGCEKEAIQIWIRRRIHSLGVDCALRGNTIRRY